MAPVRKTWRSGKFSTEYFNQNLPDRLNVSLIYAVHVANFTATKCPLYAYRQAPTSVSRDTVSTAFTFHVERI